MMYIDLVEIVLLMVMLAALIVLAALAIEWWAIKITTHARERTAVLEAENAQLKAQLLEAKQASLTALNATQVHYEELFRRERREASKQSKERNNLQVQLKTARLTIRKLQLTLERTVPTGDSAAIAQYYAKTIVDQLTTPDEPS